MKKFVLIILATTFILSGCSLFESDKDPNGVKPIAFDPDIEFVECGINQCAMFEVPMDHDDPKGRQIELKVIKKPARNQNEKIGALFINPGGPGGSGVQFVERSSLISFSDEILNKFDIVSWDPRGVGGSTKVTCARNLDPLFDGVTYSPETQQEKEKLIEATSWIAEQCANEDEELLPFLDTKSTVRDLEALRIALGEDKINYLGFSYGTVIGQIYATQFPDNIRTMVLDGVADVTIEPRQLAKDQAIGFESTLDSFFEYCKTKPCDFNQGRDPKEAYLQISESIAQNPIVSTTDRSLTLGPAHLDLGTAQYLYFGEQGWDILDRGLAQLRNGNPELLLDGFRTYVGREQRGEYNGSYISFISIGCADGAIGDVDSMFDLAAEVEPQAPVFGQSGILLGLQCSFWTGFDGETAQAFDLDIQTQSPIVVIGVTGDPATPVQWARSVASQIENSAYIEKVGEGHTIYGKGDTCIDSAVNSYLLTTKKPTTTKC